MTGGTHEHDDGAAPVRSARLLDFLLETVSVLAVDGRLLYSSDDHRGVLGYAPNTHLHSDPLGLVHPDDLEFVTTQWAEVLAHPERSIVGEFRVRAADDSWQWIEVVAHNRVDDPDIGGVVLASRNITPRVEALANADQSKRRLTAIVDHAEIVVATVSADGVFRYVSPPSINVLGQSPAELVDHVTLTDLVEGADQGMLADSIAQCGRVRGALHRLSVRVRHPHGGVRHVELTLTNLLDDPSVEAIVVNLQDVTDRVQFVDALRHQALHDPLTGLPNRALLLDRVELALARARRSHTPAALCFLDLDRFKVVNDSLGHASGDRVLVEIASRLKAAVRDTDTVARLGGDEFVVLADELLSHDGAAALAERLLHAVDHPIALDGGDVTPTVSIGVVTSDGWAKPADLLRDADAAMYQAKDDGRACVRVFDDSIAVRAHARMRDESELRRAIDRDELSLDYQPILALRTRSTVGFEALLRWDHPTRGRLPAAQFLGVAEDAGLLGSLTERILREACSDARRWHRSPAGTVRTWVNLAPVQLADPLLESMIEDALDHAGLDASAIGIEVTEGAIIGETSAVAHGIDTIARLGLPIALDDFGTGYSSLSHLHRFPVQVVKIDKSFVEPIDHRSNEIIAAIVAMSHALGLTVIAEGVESDAALERVTALGCDGAQGYLLGRPAPADTGLARLAAAG